MTPDLTTFEQLFNAAKAGVHRAFLWSHTREPNDSEWQTIGEACAARIDWLMGNGLRASATTGAQRKQADRIIRRANKKMATLFRQLQIGRFKRSHSTPQIFDPSRN